MPLELEHWKDVAPLDQDATVAVAAAAATARAAETGAQTVVGWVPAALSQEDMARLG